MKKISAKRILCVVTPLFLVLHILADFLNKIDLRTNCSFIKLSRYFKFVLVVSCALVIVSNLKQHFFKNKYKPPVVFLFIIGLFGIKNFFFPEWLTYSRYVFFIILLVAYYFLFNRHVSYRFIGFYCMKIFEVFIWINFIVVLFGLIFHVELLSTYRFARFGFNGLVLNQMQTPYLYGALLFLFYHFKIRGALMITIALILLSGVKASLIYLSLFMALYLINNLKTLSKKIKILVVIISVSSVIIIGISLILLSPRFLEIINENGILTAITSGRNINLYEIIDSASKDNFNVLLGTFGLDNFRSEFGAIDVFLFFGLSGVVLYSLIFSFVLQSLSKSQINCWYIWTTIITFSLAGNFLYFPFNCFIFILSIFFLEIRWDNKLKHELSSQLTN